MKILFLTDNFPPEVNAPATRTFEHCKEWVKLGHTVTVITCAPNFPRGKVYDGYKNKLRQEEEMEGIRVVRVWSYISANKGFLKRIIDFTSFAVMAFIFGLNIRTDVVIGTSPQFFTVISAKILAWVKRKPWVMEVRDLWPESIVTVGAMAKESLAYNLLEKIEHYLYKSASLVVVVTDSFKKYIDCIVKRRDKVVVFKNGVNNDDFRPIEKDEVLLKKYDLYNKFVVGYIGTHGMAHALDFVLACAKQVDDKRVIFILQGDGSEKEKLIKSAQKERLENVLFLPFVSKKEIKRYLSIIDVALVNLKKSETFKSVIPSKIFENACMQKPILLGVEGESKAIIENYNAGVSYEPENIQDFLSALKHIVRDYKNYQKGCENLAKDFHRPQIAYNLIQEIDKLVK